MEVQICLDKKDIQTSPFFNNIQISTKGQLSIFLTQDAAAELITDLAECLKYFEKKKEDVI
jgi:hypothetical protein